MRRILLFAAIALVALAAAAGLRARDAPYIAYERGDRAGALEGLTKKADAGDGFAAFLVGRIYQSGNGIPADQRAAAAWYMAAARAGEIRAVHAYLVIVLGQAPGDEVCRKAIALLQLAARTGEPGALLVLGERYRLGQCVPIDPIRATAYFAAAARVDRRLEKAMDHLRASLAEDELRAVRPLPERFDLDARQALARFVSEAPALLPDSLH